MSTKIPFSKADSNSNNENFRTYVLSGGGTGGHLFPALSLADEIETAGHKALLVTDNRGLAFFKHNQRMPSLVCTIVRNHWLFGKFVYPFSLGFQILRCFLWLSKIKPTAVIGFGGYPSFPCVFAAQCMRIPTILHEGNSFLGKANRYLLPKAKKVVLSFPPTKEQLLDSRFHVTGNPVRKGVCELINNTYIAPTKENPFHILVVGGSQGAKIFSTLIPEAISKLPKTFQKRIVITQQCRQQQIEETENKYKTTLCKVNLKIFLSPIENYYKDAHLIIGRSGASTVAEVAIAGKPTLFIPFPGSIEGDQAQNAVQLVDKNAAWLMRETSITPEKVARFLTTHLENSDELLEKAQAIRSFAYPDAAKNVWKIVAEII
ncbi:MAG: undecaprenyldiphospho-muramoylpentapeptide beta-N-acetylglucosaminyltransferase [Candidatus Paracaedibacteraceae bacterium]|nr:undecaprenyldiphospho-muramoylpentapeptide beta-N-acetylglucosaminyltransferase [Candidatus Paracaedibacteraceae bacterium]